MLEKQKNDFKEQLDAIMIKHSINEKTINDQKNQIMALNNKVHYKETQAEDAQREKGKLMK